MSEQHSQNRVTYFTAAVMNLCIWLPAYYMRSPVGEFMSVCEEGEREGETASSQESSQILIGVVSVCTECTMCLLESI